VEGVPEGLKQALAKARAPTASTLVGFDGSMDGQAVLPAGEMVPPGSEPDNRMTWKQLTYDYMVSGDRLQVLAQLQWPGPGGGWRGGLGGSRVCFRVVPK